MRANSPQPASGLSQKHELETKHLKYENKKIWEMHASMLHMKVYTVITVYKVETVQKKSVSNLTLVAPTLL